MSFLGFGRRRPRRTTRRNDVQESALAHVGTLREFLIRHRRDCSRYYRSNEADQAEFRNSLIERIVDTRNLMAAVMHIVAKGEKAAGPNGQQLYRLYHENPNFVWAELRTLSGQLSDGTYQPGPTRRRQISKDSGGTRTIEVSNWQDQVVQRAIVQILDPLLDTQLDELSLGFRTERDRFEALAKAEVRIEQEGRPVLLCTDLTNAFSNIPHAPLLEEIQRRFGNEMLTRLVGRIIRAGNRRKGVAQGGPLSPLLLNLHLDRNLDQRWRRACPTTPLIRYADDLLVLCRSEEEALHCRSELERILQPTGMKLNARKTYVRHLEREPVEWLGYTLWLENGELQINLASDFYARARKAIREAVSQPDGSLRAAETIQGIFDQLGPCYYTTQTEDVFHHLAGLSEREGFDEFPEYPELLRTSQRSAVRYLVQRRLWSILYVLQRETVDDTGDGSAICQLFPACPAPTERSSDLVAAPPSNTSSPPAAILTVVAISRFDRLGGWAYHLHFSDQPGIRTELKTGENHTEIRAALKGLLEGLKEIAPRYAVRVVTNSTYLCSDWRETVNGCLTRGGRTLEGQTLKNWDLLLAVSRLVSWRRVSFEFR